MALWITPAEAQRLRARELNLALLFRMKPRPSGAGAEAAEALRLWSGIGDFRAPDDPLDGVPNPLYKGAGDVLDLPELAQLINGEADRVDFKLSGVGERAERLADLDQSEIEGARVNIGVVVLDAGLQPATGILWLWSGEADVLKPEWNGLGDEPIYSLTLSAATQSAQRRRNAIAYYSPTQQRRRSPGDKGCDRVGVFTTGHRLPWPQF